MSMNESFGRFRGPLGFQKAGASDASRVDAFLIKPTSVTGRELINGVGEVLVDVSFPVWFTERPNVSFGGELDTNDSPTDTQFPTVSVVVVAWQMKKEERLGGGYFIGCNLAVVTGGRKDNRIWVHWRAEGAAMKNPAVDSN